MPINLFVITDDLLGSATN